MRVHELAKELKMDSKILIPKLKEMGVEAKSHMSSLEEEQADKVRNMLGGATLIKSKKPKAPKKASQKKSQQAPETTSKASRSKAPKVISRETVEEAPIETPAEALIEKRVSGTVIRRRKKAPLPEPEPTIEAETVKEQEVVPEKEVKEEKPSVAAKEAEPQKEAVPARDKDKKKEEVEAKPVKKPKIKTVKEKEKTPARIIDRIDLSPRKEAETAPAATAEEQTQRPDDTKKKTLEVPSQEIEKKAGVKGKARRKKFNWQKESLEEEEFTSEAAPQKRVRYKVKGKPAGKGRRHKAEVIPFYKAPEKTVPRAIKRKIRIYEGIVVAELAKKMGVKSAEVIKKLVDLGEMATINQFLEVDTASIIASDFGYEIETVPVEEETIFKELTQDSEGDLQPRCPVVTVMGHVDHGKTSLLDAIRNTQVAEGEKGGITQHIGAYRVSTKGGDIAFVDTPGHEAFTTMRARGAQVTDIVILVVAAEEGAKPQTIEAINHARAADVPIIVAINKIDKPEADPEKVRQELSQHGLVSENWGGDIIFAEVSAKKKQGLEKLLEMVLLQSEILELKANPDKPAKGTIIEARLDRGRGPIATVLIQEGTLKAGDPFVSRHNFGKVRALIDDRGRKIKKAGPSTPVEITGFSSVPEAGDVFIAVDEKKARQTSIYWQQKKREEELRKDSRVSLETFLSTSGDEDVKELKIIIKADVQGSAEALKQSLENLSTDEIKVNIIHNSVGAISLNDVMLASASNAIVIGFGVKIEPKVQEEANQEKVDVRVYGIIYEVIDDVKKAMVGMLAPKFVEKISGKAEVRQVFDISKYGTVAGCFVVDGRVVNGTQARVTRNSEVIYEGKITSLKKFKDDAKEVLSGQDCGIYLGSFKEFQEGDIIESFVLEEVERTL